MLLGYFGETIGPCGNCDNCAEPPEMFDGSIAAQKALSCIHRTGERFGQAYIISVLLGETDERIQRFGHDQLSTFGIGTEHDKRAWRSILRQLVAQELIRVDLSGHGGLSIAPKGRAFLREKPKLMMRLPSRAKMARRKRRGAAPELTDAGRGLFEALRAKRMEIARAQGVPPYVIFHDKTLAEMASVRPSSRADLAEVSGIGAAKLERYGDAFLAVIAEHRAA